MIPEVLNSGALIFDIEPFQFLGYAGAVRLCEAFTHRSNELIRKGGIWSVLQDPFLWQHMAMIDGGQL